MVLSLFVMIAIRSRRYTCIEVGLVVVFLRRRWKSVVQGVAG